MIRKFSTSRESQAPREDVKMKRRVSLQYSALQYSAYKSFRGRYCCLYQNSLPPPPAFYIHTHSNIKKFLSHYLPHDRKVGKTVSQTFLCSFSPGLCPVSQCHPDGPGPHRRIKPKLSILVNVTEAFKA